MRGPDQPGRNPVRQQEQGQQEPAPSRPSPTPGNAHRTGHRGAADSATAIGNENRSAALHQGACSGDAPSTVSAQSKAGMTGQQLSAKASDEKCGEFPIRRTRRLISRRHPNQRRPLVFRPAFVIGRNGTGIELHLLKALRLPVSRTCCHRIAMYACVAHRIPISMAAPRTATRPPGLLGKRHCRRGCPRRAHETSRGQRHRHHSTDWGYLQEARRGHARGTHLRTSPMVWPCATSSSRPPSPSETASSAHPPRPTWL